LGHCCVVVVGEIGVEGMRFGLVLAVLAVLSTMVLLAVSSSSASVRAARHSAIKDMSGHSRHRGFIRDQWKKAQAAVQRGKEKLKNTMGGGGNSKPNTPPPKSQQQQQPPPSSKKKPESNKPIDNPHGSHAPPLKPNVRDQAQALGLEEELRKKGLRPEIASRRSEQMIDKMKKMKIDPESPTGQKMIKMMEAGDISKLTPQEMEEIAKKARVQAEKEAKAENAPVDYSKLTDKDIKVVNQGSNAQRDKGWEQGFGSRRTKL